MVDQIGERDRNPYAVRLHHEQRHWYRKELLANAYWQILAYTHDNEPDGVAHWQTQVEELTDLLRDWAGEPETTADVEKAKRDAQQQFSQDLAKPFDYPADLRHWRYGKGIQPDWR